jgi:hypothetical protein
MKSSSNVAEQPAPAKTNRSAIGKFPSFVTEQHLAEADELERDVSVLVKQIDSVNPASIRARFDTALRNYCAAPIEENFVLLKAAASEAIISQSTTFTRLRTCAHTALREKLFDARFVPWARSIIEAGLTAARASLANVIASEEARHQELTGESLNGKPNAIIGMASRPVAELEEHLRLLDPSAMAAGCEHQIFSFLKFIRERAAESKTN